MNTSFQGREMKMSDRYEDQLGRPYENDDRRGGVDYDWRCIEVLTT